MSKKDIKASIVIFIICFIPRVLVNMQMPFISIISDEVSTISAAAMTAGYDWKGVFTNAGYYGGGAAILLTPLFLLIDNSVVLFKCIINLYALLQALVGIIAYAILKKHVKYENIQGRVLLSIIASYLVAKRATILLNETPLILCTWIVAYILLELYQADNKQRKKYSIVLGALTAYMLSIHTRAVTYTIALIIMTVLVFLYNRKKVLNLFCFIAPYGIFYVIANLIKESITNFYFTSENSAYIRNSEVLVTKSLDIFNFKGIQTACSLLLGQLGTVTVLSGGMFVLALVVVIYMLAQVLLKRLNEEEEGQFFVIAYFTGCVIITMVGLVITWFGSTSVSMLQGTGGTSYGLKGLTYIRYFASYIGPLIVISMAYWIKNLVRYNAVVFYIISFVMTMFSVAIIPYIYNSTSAIEVFLPFMRQSMDTATAGNLGYIMGVSVCLVVTMITLVLWYKKRVNIGLTIMIIFLIYQYVYNGLYLDASLSVQHTAKRVSTYEVLYNINEELPEIIYIEDGVRGSNQDHQIYYTYQFLFKAKKVVAEIPSEFGDSLYITNTITNHESIFNAGFKMVELPDNTDYVFVRGKEYEKVLENNGFYLHDFNIYNNTIKLESKFGSFWSDQVNLTSGTYRINNLPEDCTITIYNGVNTKGYEILKLDDFEYLFVVHDKLSAVQFQIQGTNITNISYNKIGSYSIESEVDYVQLKTELLKIGEFSTKENMDESFDSKILKVGHAEKLPNGEFVLLCKGDDELNNYLSRSKIIYEAMNFYLLEIDERVPVELSEENNKVIHNRLDIGVYIIELQNEVEEIQLAGLGYRSEIYDVVDGMVEIIVPYNITNWYMQNNGKRESLKSIVKVEKNELLEHYLSVVNFISEGKKLYCKEMDDEEQVMLMEVSEREGIQIVDAEEAEEADYILMNNSFMLNENWGEYIPVEKNERYTLFESKKHNDAIIDAYDVKSMLTDSYDLPKGTYEINAVIQLNSTDDSDRTVEFKTANGFNRKIYSSPTVEDLEEGSLEVSFIIASYIPIDSLTVSLVDYKYIQDSVEVINFKQISEEYIIDLSEIDELVEEQIIIGSGEEVIISGLDLEAGSYEVVIVYEENLNKFTATLETGDSIIMDYNISENSIEIMDYRTVTVGINPSTRRENCKIIISNGENDLTIEEIKIIKL